MDNHKINSWICSVWLVYLSNIFAGQWLISNKHEGRKISSPDYSSLKNGETVYGELENIVKDCGSGEDAYGLPLVYYLVRTSDEKLLVVRTEAGEKCDQAISNALGNSGKVPFVGYVKSMKEKEKPLYRL